MDCVFCKIARGEIPCDRVYEDDDAIAFSDLDKQAPVHILVIPKKHLPNVLALSKEPLLASHIMSKVIPAIVKEQNLEEKGFRLVANTGDDGGQTVPHLHFHILGGRSMTWPPG